MGTTESLFVGPLSSSNCHMQGRLSVLHLLFSLIFVIGEMGGGTCCKLTGWFKGYQKSIRNLNMYVTVLKTFEMSEDWSAAGSISCFVFWCSASFPVVMSQEWMMFGSVLTPSSSVGTNEQCLSHRTSGPEAHFVGSALRAVCVCFKILYIIWSQPLD